MAFNIGMASQMAKQVRPIAISQLIMNAAAQNELPNMYKVTVQADGVSQLRRAYGVFIPARISLRGPGGLPLNGR